MARRFQFRLRTMFVVTTIIAVQCAVCLPMVREIRAARRQAELFTPLELTGGPGSSVNLQNVRPLTKEEINQLFFPPHEEESWLSDLLR